MGWGLSNARLEELHERAAGMRRNPTEPEKRLWRNLSNGQLGGHKFRRQSVVGRFIADFLCPQKALIVEVDGDTHDERKDRLRDDILSRHGFRVVRVTNDDVMGNMDGVLQHILLALNEAPERWNKPHPNPSPEGEGLEGRDRPSGGEGLSTGQKCPSPSGEGLGVGPVRGEGSAG
ncbi:MAG TPA: DUF559 domain-containing protein [Allosphingosinicella sp.]